jgi:hypothetical protein
MSEPTHAFERITPAQAEKMLRTNEVNRQIRPSRVAQYARDMENDRWNFSAPLMFDTEGKLIDGQHRLTAQVKAKKTLKWLVIRGVPSSAQRTMDNTGVRTPADQLHMGGEKNASLLVAVARNIYRIENDMMAGGTTISTEEVLRTVETHPELRHSVEMAIQSRGKSITPIAPNVVGAGHWMIAQVNGQAEADMFIWRVINLTGERDGSPVLALARRCNEIKRQQQRVAHRDYLAMLIKAWNYDVEGKSINKIATYSKTGQYVLPDVLKREIPLADRLDEYFDGEYDGENSKSDVPEEDDD